MSTALSRSTDPFTSLNAGRKMRSTNDTERLVLEALLEHGPMTTHRIAVLIGLPVVTVSPRIKPLRKKLLVENSGLVEYGRSIWRALPQMPGLVITKEMLDAAEALEKLAPYSRAPKVKEDGASAASTDPIEPQTRIDVSPHSTPDLKEVSAQLELLRASQNELDDGARGKLVFDSFLSPEERELMAAQTAADKEVREKKLAAARERAGLVAGEEGVVGVVGEACIAADPVDLIESTALAIASAVGAINLEAIVSAASPRSAEIVDSIEMPPVRKHRKKAPAVTQVNVSKESGNDNSTYHTEQAEASFPDVAVHPVSEIIQIAGSKSSEIMLNITITLKIDVSSNGVKILMVH